MRGLLIRFCSIRLFTLKITLFWLTFAAALHPASAQQPFPPATAAAAAEQARIAAENALKLRKNAWTVGIATGQLEAAYPRLAADLAKALDDGDNLRILRMITYGSVGNVEDLLYLRNVEIAFTKSDSFEYFKKVKKIQNISARIHYIARLFDAELHILVRPEIKSLQDLNGKKVNLGTRGNAANVTAPIVFERLGIKVEAIFVDHNLGLEMMKKGEIAAALRVAGKPADTFAKIPANSGFYFLPISAADYAQHFTDVYMLGKLNSEDYPTLIPAGESINTISVPDILAAYNWQKGTERAARVDRFITALYKNFDKLQEAPYHPKWRDVNLAATLPGWTRAEAAERMVKQMGREEAGRLKPSFDAFVKARAGTTAATGQAAEQNNEALFREFMTWRNKQQ